MKCFSCRITHHVWTENSEVRFDLFTVPQSPVVLNPVTDFLTVDGHWDRWGHAGGHVRCRRTVRVLDTPGAHQHWGCGRPAER